MPRYEAPAIATLAPISFPRDNGSHEALTEWWYYTGHLTSASNRYGFEFVVFRSMRSSGPVGFASHFAITNQRETSFAFDQRFRVVSSDPVRAAPDFSPGDWSLRGVDGTDHIRASMPRYSLALQLVSRKPPVLHGGRGVISFGPAGDSYYYSRTRLEATGSLTIDGALEAVTGVAWMDHQWGDFISATGGWDWFSFQFDDETELTGSVVRDKDGASVLTYGTFVDPLGVPAHLDASEFLVQPLANWQSPRSGAIYPAAWRIRVPSLGIDIESRPIVSDQELDTRASTGVVYWEGAVDAGGRSRGRPVTGRGYVELTGYAARVTENSEGATR